MTQTKMPTPLKDRLAAVRDLVDGITLSVGASVSEPPVNVPLGLLEQVSDLLSEAIHDIDTRKSMIQETVEALRGKDVMVKPPEMRAISNMSADLRNGLTAMPDDTPGRSLVVRAAETLHDTLGAIVSRDRSWT